ncbi:hypothetical protein [Prosthecomicrobium sp. N25]|uniref:hypothetical protein n=1 Tax=Prosthecomicrobium sp. N25 TaxID=3129254 RepID=UPI00307764DF
MPDRGPLGTLLRLLRRLVGAGYEPSRHYMRGPGPATRARLDREAGDGGARPGPVSRRRRRPR